MKTNMKTQSIIHSLIESCAHYACGLIIACVMFLLKSSVGVLFAVDGYGAVLIWLLAVSYSYQWARNYFNNKFECCDSKNFIFLESLIAPGICFIGIVIFTRIEMPLFLCFSLGYFGLLFCCRRISVFCLNNGADNFITEVTDKWYIIKRIIK